MPLLLSERDFFAPDPHSMKREIKKCCPFFSRGDFVALYGELGAGKTFTVQTICDFFNVRDKVTSPSFAFVNHYSGDFEIYHVDLYRLETPEDLLFLGWDDIIASKSLKLIEWADRIDESFLPLPRWEIHIDFAKSGGRNVKLLTLRDKEP